MTVSSTTTRVAYTGDGGTTVFAVPFQFLANSDIAVYLDDVKQVAGFSTSGAGGTGGTVTFATAPAAATSVVLLREQPDTQPTVLTPNGPFPAKGVETMADRMMLGLQQLGETLSRTLRFPVSDAAPVVNAMPSRASRLGKFFGWDAGGDPVALSGTGNDAALRTDLASGLAGALLVAFKSSGVGAVVRTLWAVLLDRPWSIKNFGALVDGVTDDSAAINAASLASSLAGAATYFPHGTCIGVNLRQYTNSKWLGGGCGSVIKLKAGAAATDTFIQNDQIGTNIDGSDAAGNNHILMRDLQLDGNKANQTQAIPLIRWRLVKYSQITGCHLINSKGMGLDATNGVDHCVIDGNVFRNNVGVDVSIRFVSNRCFLTNNCIIGANLPVIDGGEAGAVSDDAIQIKATANSGTRNFNCAEFVVSGNVVKGKVQALVLEGVFDSVVTGNVFGSQTGSTIVSSQSATYFCQGLVISQNAITQEAAAAFFGLALTGGRLLVEGNQITSDGATPICIAPGDNNSEIIIEGNVAKFTVPQDVAPGISVRDAGLCLIRANEVRNARDGIHIDSLSPGVEMRYVAIDGNMIYNTSRTPIRVDNGGDNRKIRALTISNNMAAEFGAQAANTYDGIYIAQSGAGGVIEDVHVSANSFYDYSGNPRDAIRLSGTVDPIIIEPNQKVKGINGVIVTGYYAAAPGWAGKVGQRIYTFAPAAGGTEGWLWTAGGAWKAFGSIAA